MGARSPWPYMTAIIMLLCIFALSRVSIKRPAHLCYGDVAKVNVIQSDSTCDTPIHIKGNGTASPRILVTDVMFPNSLAAWRLNEIGALMMHFPVDVLVTRRISHAPHGVRFLFDFDELKESHYLQYYEILVFNETALQYDVFNAQPNGRTYLGALNADYMLRHVRYHGQKVDLSDYDYVYHIFYHNYLEFYSLIGDVIPSNRHIVHMFPGGGLFSLKNLEGCCHPGSHLIVAQPFIHEWLDAADITNSRISMYGGYFFTDCQEKRSKPLKRSRQLTVSFASVGDILMKGADTYVHIAKQYRLRYPNDHGVTFVGIGSVPDSKFVVKLPVMSQKKLDDFYYQHVDVAFNLDRTDRWNGWPLGIEALVQGCLLFSTDNYNMNRKTGFNFGEELFIVDDQNIGPVLERLHELYLNPSLLHELSLKSQERARYLFGYENTMGKVIPYIKSMYQSPL